MQPEQQVVTGEAVALDLQLAGPGSRGIAALIDFAIATFAQGLVLLLVVSVSWSSIDAIITVLIVTEVVVVLGYPVAMETLWRGRTLGKAAMGLRVVRDDGGPIRFRHALVRGIVGVVIEKPGFTYGLCALIFIVATNRKKRLGDLAAGTMVLQERVPGKIDAPVMMPPPLAGWAAGLDLTAVDDALALRIRHFIARAAQLLPDARGSLEHQLASEVVARVGQPPPGTPGWAVLTAVLAERRRRAWQATQPVAAAWPGHSAAYGMAPPPAPPAPPAPAPAAGYPAAGYPAAGYDANEVPAPGYPPPGYDANEVAAPAPSAEPAITGDGAEPAPATPPPTGFAPPG